MLQLVKIMFGMGAVYDSTGFYTNIYSDVNGCDSIVRLDLIINYNSYSFDTIISCDSYLWNGNVFNTSGVLC